MSSRRTPLAVLLKTPTESSVVVPVTFARMLPPLPGAAALRMRKPCTDTVAATMLNARASPRALTAKQAGRAAPAFVEEEACREAPVPGPTAGSQGTLLPRMVTAAVDALRTMEIS